MKNDIMAETYDFFLLLYIHTLYIYISYHQSKSTGTFSGKGDEGLTGMSKLQSPLTVFIHRITFR